MKKTYLTPATIIADFKVCEPLLSFSEGDEQTGKGPNITVGGKGESGGQVSGGGLVRPWQGNFDREDW